MFVGTEKLTHTYMPGTPFANHALKDISFGLAKGAFALLIGPSGSGKSTLIQHINGLLKPTSGQVYFDGLPVGSDKAELLRLRKRVGLVFQMPEEHFFSETVYDEVAFAPRNLGYEEDKVEQSVVEALRAVGLDSAALAGRHPFQLSAGQKRLVALASVLSLKPEMLILDEPTAGLDSAGQAVLFALLAGLNRRAGLTVLVCTHHLDAVAALADTVLVLHQGRLVLKGPANDILSKRKKLVEIGLGLPQVTEIMHSLAESGFNVNTATYTLEAARQEINKVKGQLLR